MNPPQVRDLLHSLDHHMLVSQNDQEDPHEEIDETLSEADEEGNAPSQPMSGSSKPSSYPGYRSTPPPSRRAAPNASPPPMAPVPQPTMSPSASHTMPVINLSDASTSRSRQRFGSTGQKRKSSAQHNNMTDVAKHAGKSMVQQLKDMTEVSKCTEKEKL
jgi:hypothetical protein